MKLKKYKRGYFKCPNCAHETNYILRIMDAPEKNAYWCETCRTTSRLKNRILLGTAYGVALGAVISILIYWIYTKFFLDYAPVVIFLAATPFGLALSWLIFPYFAKLFFRWEKANGKHA